MIGTVALVLLAAGPLCAAGTSDAKTFSLYTVSGAARSLSSPVASGDVKPLAYKAGDTVTVVNPRTGATAPLVSSAAAAGDYSWTPDAGVGGTWTLTRTPSSGSAETATFTVASAAGTLADPVGVYTSAELEDNKADGGYYRLLGDAALTAPEGYKLFVAGDGVFWLTTNQKSVAPTYSGNGTSSATATFHLHTATVSDNATTREPTSLSDLRPITYKAEAFATVTGEVAIVEWTPGAAEGEWKLAFTAPKSNVKGAADELAAAEKDTLFSLRCGATLEALGAAEATHADYRRGRRRRFIHLHGDRHGSL